MIDNFAIGLTHALLLLAGWLLTRRRDLDDERPEMPKAPRRRA
jgi:LPXTG-motif cell wall-anchored protein